MRNWKDGVFHNPSGVYWEGWEGGLGSLLSLRLRCPQGAPVEKVFFRHAPDGEQHMVEARRVDFRPGWDCDWWEVQLKWVNPRFHYRFWLLGPEGGYWLSAMGVVRHCPTDHFDFQILAQQPEGAWWDRSVFYQIFPDRFCQGDPSHRVRTGEYRIDGQPVVARRWGELPDVRQGSREFFGGDLAGITSKLDYIQERLGVNALYLNPIHTSPSSHKYDVASYTEIDSHLGGQSAFLELKAALEKRSMRLVLDIVPNHCGDQHPWFREAIFNPEGDTAEFFTFLNHPDDYECWLGVRSLPKLNYASLKLREAMYQGQDSILRRWLRPPFNIDGWRLDVANMLGRQGAVQLGHKVLRGMRRAVKAEKPEAYFLGEHFFDASPSLQGDQLDAAMNYRGFMMPLYHWLAGRHSLGHGSLSAQPAGQSRHPPPEEPGRRGSGSGGRGSLTPLHLSRRALYLLRRRDWLGGRTRSRQSALYELG